MTKICIKGCEEMTKKYELTSDSIVKNGRTLYRIKALVSFGDVQAGDLGGYISHESNLSHRGECWVYCKAVVYGNARVYGDAWVDDNAIVSGNARIYGNAWLFGCTIVSGNARAYGKVRVAGYAVVCGNARVYGKTFICGRVRIGGHARVCGGKIDSIA